MLHDHIWSLTGIGKNDGKLCISCVEKRLNRKLTPADFMDIPLNFGGHMTQSDKLKKRLGIVV
jgi:hypothetical protein